jgi:hypothetical protein
MSPASSTIRTRSHFALCVLAGLVLALGVGAPTASAEPPPRVIVSVDEQGNPAFGSYGGMITPDGRFAAFSSFASNLPRGGIGPDCPVTYVRSLETGGIWIVSRTSEGSVVCGESARISNDGRLVLFSSVDGSMPGPPGAVFVRDLELGTTEVASRDTDGTILSGDATISGNGRFVAFQASVPDGEGIFLRNIRGRRTRELTADANGDSLPPTGNLSTPSLSVNGRFVVAPLRPMWNSVPPGWEWFDEACSSAHSCPLLYDRVTHTSSIAGGDSGIDGITEAEVSPRGSYIAWGGPYIAISDRETGEVVTTNADGTFEVQWSGNERFLLGYNWSQYVTRYNVATGRPKRVAGTGHAPCEAGGLTADGRFAGASCWVPGEGGLIYLVGPIG